MTYNGQTGSHPPAFGGFAFTNSTGDSSPFAFEMAGLPSDHIKGIAARDLTFTNIASADKVSDADSVTFSKVTVNGKTVTH